MKCKCYILLTFVFLLLTSCSTPNACNCKAKKAPKPRPLVHDSYESYDKTYKFMIVSNPPGAKIYVNGKKVGITPVYHTVTAKISPNAYRGNFAIYEPVRLNIIAHPAQEGQYIQEQDIEINPDNLDTVPARVVFNMSVNPQRPRYTAGYK